jgi:aminopeptidase N
MKHSLPFIKAIPVIFALALSSLVNAQGTVSFDTAHYGMRHSYDVLNYKLNLDIYASYTTPYPKSFAAKEVITFRVDTALSSIRLNATGSSLQIDSVRMAGISFTHVNDTLKIALNRTYQPGEIVNVKVCYHHKNVTDYSYNAGSGFVFFDFPPEGARKCFPCWDRPSDKATWDLTAKVPDTVRLGSNGRLADSTVTGDTIYYHWVSADPMSTYLMTLTSKVGFKLDIRYWHKLSNPSDSIPIRYYYKYPENPATIEALMTPMTNYFSERFGEYPFEKIGFATLNNLFQWGGMENQTMINLQSNGYQEGLISHEFSHQWVGDLVTCGTWADVWLNESFGTYSEALWLENTSGYTAYKDHLNTQANYYLGQNPGWPIYNPLWAIHTPPSGQLYNTAIIYYKGACVLHQLRYVLGDSLFLEVLHAYTTDTNFMFRNAVTEDFVNKVNEVTGQDYTWFFDEWIYHGNHPLYDNTYEIDDLGGGNWKVKFFIGQTQTNTVFFRMPVEIRVNFTDATDTVIRVENNVNHQAFEFLFTKQPSGLIFDPYRNILLKHETTVVSIREEKPRSGYYLFQNVPNPVTGSTQIKYSIPKPSAVKILIVDSSGKPLATAVDRKFESQGIYEYAFPAENYSPGVYYIRMESGNFSQTRKMIIIK